MISASSRARPSRLRCWFGAVGVLLSVVLSCGAAPAPSEDDILLGILWDQTRSLPGQKELPVGLALGGGGARGLAHIGVLKVFEQEGIPIDRLAGNSVGALIGALYAAGTSTSELETMARDIGWSALTDFSTTSFIRLLLAQSLLSTERMEEYLRRHMGDLRFNELRIPFVCAATDLQTGERVVFREGPVAQAARASATIPGLFKPVVFRHRYLVDGGLVGNMATDLARSIGAKLVIAVDVSSDFSAVETPNVLTTVTQAVYIQGQQLNRDQASLADLVLTPAVAQISPIDLTQSLQCVDAGTQAARRKIRDVKALIIDSRFDALLNGRRPS